MLLHFGSTAVRAQGRGEILDILRGFPSLTPRARPTLLLYADGDIPSLVEGVQTLAQAMPTTEVKIITRDQHQAAELPAGLLTYLHHWFNHIDLKANTEIYVELPGWLAGKLAKG